MQEGVVADVRVDRWRHLDELVRLQPQVLQEQEVKERRLESGKNMKQRKGRMKVPKNK